jgi:hypothetical protein
VLAAEDVQGQVAELLVVAVEETALLVAVQRVIGGIQVEDDLGRRGGVRLQEQIYEQALDSLGAGDDLVVAAVGGGLGWGQLQADVGALAGQGFPLVPGAQAVQAGGIGLADEGRQQGIETQGVVIIEVFVAQGESVVPLADELERGVFEGLGVALAHSRKETRFAYEMAAATFATSGTCRFRGIAMT